jgi:anti-sigma-K factor RskA
VDLGEIRSSALLELYVMGQLTPAETAEVEAHLITFPELRVDLREIEGALQFFAQAASLTAPAGIKGKIMEAIKDDFIPDTRSGGGIWRMLSILLSLGALLLGYLFMQRGNEVTRLEGDLTALRDTCQTTQDQLNQQLDRLRQLTLPENRILPFTATPTFAATDLYLHHNTNTQRNFIQVRNLPQIAADQTFELWSLRTGQAPARMDLFDAPPDGLVEVQFIAGTEIYAITIEPEGGVDAPTMANLIGTVSVLGQ